MGVPKFFRYISERYPCLSETVKDYEIPEFDNLYLDMNGIIHTCSHPDDNDPHFRISEEKIFQDIFHYIEVLFRMIKPQKVFFMAVDGVAPRAKMNQQRGRRFRSAKEAQDLEKKARDRGETLPSEARFDSNCITPGTVFMTHLHEQLKYFIVNKISTDKLWSKCKVILSGHETPGEGEHKIMDYIRYLRAQPGYDPNTRHCLYGLDADLIMLGLCTHEPHFSLLREEVKFGKKSNSKRKNVPEETKFFLLHLSLMREYLELEFYSLKSKLKFKYDMEKVIDDWVLMGFLVGNDFIPHLPNMHINNGALPTLYKAYMEVLPTLDGYINENGHLNLVRFEAFIHKLGSIDMDNFSERFADLKWFEGKTGHSINNKMNRRPNKFRQLESWQTESDGIVEESLEPSVCEPALAALIQSTDDMLNDSSDSSTQEDKDMEEVDSECGDYLLNAEFVQHKNDYYINKLSYANVTPEVLRSQTEEYVRAIQWNLHYYYNGVCSWSWYYPHHYAPYVSDVKGFADFKINFELGTPFKPYEQLLAVLPAASKELLPVPFQNLMISENSPIKEYYPEDFKTDLNGKRQEWEAVVLIPFIAEDTLLEAMESVECQLSAEEKSRNRHGPMLVYKYTVEDFGPYEAPKYFSKIMHSHALCERVTIEDIRIPREKLIKGAYPGALFDVYYPGFPTMKHLNYKGELQKAKVKVFEQPSREENMILHIIKEEQEVDTNLIARNLLGTVVHVGWPHLTEALVVCVTDKEHVIKSVGDEKQYNVEPNRGETKSRWEANKIAIDEFYKNRLGINVGSMNVLVTVRLLAGRKYDFTPHGYVTLEKQWMKTDATYPLQTVISKLKVYEQSYTSYKDVASVFPVGSICFMLVGPLYYGAMGEIKESRETLKNGGRIKLMVKKVDEPDLSLIKERENSSNQNYVHVYYAATKCNMAKHMFSRITGSMFVFGLKHSGRKDDMSKTNIGLNLKFTKRNEEIPGYTKKEGTTWKYSFKAIDLVKSFVERFQDVFEKVLDNDSGDYFEEDLFPEGNSKERLNEIVQWMKEQPYFSIERKSCGSDVMEPENVQLLENVIEEYNNTMKIGASVLMQVKPSLLYKPDLQMGNLMPDPNASFKLYDRVVNVREGYSVPLGLKGVIIGVHRVNTEKEVVEVLYDVLFDEEFPGGMPINCTKNRCYRMPVPAMINISHGLREDEKSTLRTTRNTDSNRGTRYNNVPPPLLNSTVIYPSNLSNYQNVPPPNWSRGPNFPPKNPQFIGQSQPKPLMSYTPPGHLAFANSSSNYNSGPNSFVPYKGSNSNTGVYLLKQPFVRESKPLPKNTIGVKETYNPNFNKKPQNVVANPSVVPNSNMKIDTDMLKKMLKINESSHSDHQNSQFNNLNNINAPKVLSQFYSKPPVNTVPEPPKKWQNFNQQPKQSLKSKGKQQGETNKVVAGANNGSTVGRDTNFVPLQAIQQQRSRTFSNKGSLNSSMKANNNAAESNATSGGNEVDVKSHSSNSNDVSKMPYKPRRQRKMRIAANFPSAQQ